MPNSELFENLKAELRRGTLVVAVLAQLRKEQYGYQLRVALSECGLDVEENTLYPLVRRLESQGLLVSEWREEDKRQKRFYRLSPDGAEMLEKLRAELWHINEALGRML
ncbi:MAG: helix-turn-helix transcriptional regulator [Opitutaceae bacterium]|nr:helix-turn-helix transcriptional regulator [Opitutaceae bacterium]